MPIVAIPIAALLGYLIGAVPSGVIVGRRRGVDPRSGGSGRTGATNALRTLGTGLAAIVLAADVAKGAVAVLVGGFVASALGAVDGWAAAAAGVGAVVGHVRSVFIGFSGGRGVATGGGAMLVLAPWAVAAAVPVLAIAVWLTRFVSLGSILAAVTVAGVAAGLAIVGSAPREAAVAGLLIGLVVVVAHADNIERLRAGTERRLGRG